jgi:MinD-like ATPase involved in chromosome partitioning or flagellar assembly
MPLGARLPRAPKATVVAVGSGKGGVGTSTVAALLAATMAAAGHRVLLVDAGQRLGALHHLLGVEPAGSLSELRGGERMPNELLVPVAERLFLFPSTVDEGVLRSTERQLLMRRVRSLYDEYALVVVDAGSSAESLVGACTDGATRLLAVTGADRISLVATYALVKLLHERANNVRVDILANRVSDESADLLHDYLNAASVRFLSRTVPFAGTIPEDPDFGSALAAGLGTDEAVLGSNAAIAVRAIGERLLTDSAVPSPNSLYRLLRKG